MRPLACCSLLLLAACSGGPPTMDTATPPVYSSAPQSELVDVHSRARPLEVRTTHVELDWEVDFERRQLRGSARFTLAVAPNATRCVLDTRDLAIESVTDASGRDLRFRLGERDPLLGSALEVELPQGVDTLLVRYHTTEQGSGLQWLLPEQTAGKRAPYLFSQAQAIHARTILPCQDSPGIRVTYGATVRVPGGLTAVMSAENRSRPDERGVFR